MTQIFYNGNFISADEAILSPTSLAALYGKGVFTTIAVYRSELFGWEKHQTRLLKDAVAIGLDVSGIDWLSIKDAMLKTIEHNGLVNGRIRVTLFDETPAAMWFSDGKTKISVMINAGAFRPLPESFILGISPYRINSSSPLAGLKSCNYLENLVAINEAKANGADEAVRLNERDEVAGGCMSNIFWSKGGQLFTPHLTTGCLAGTTREFILENMECSEVAVRVDELNDANSIFLTSAGIGVVRVNIFNRRTLENSNHDILELLLGLNHKQLISFSC